MLAVALAGCGRGEPARLDAKRETATATAQPAAMATVAPSPASAPGPTPNQPAPAEQVRLVECLREGCFDISRAMEHVRALAVDVGPREAGSGAYERAAQYVRDEMESLGVPAYLQPFPLPQGGISWNVVGLVGGVPFPARPEDAPSPGRPYLLLGGHLDTVPGAPGGNDNASGIGVILDIVHALRAQPSDLPVVFVAFGAEERQPGPPGTHHIGSRAYVEQMTEAARRDLVAMINVDMVGWGKSIVLGRLSVGPREATERLVRLAERVGVPARERVTPDWSDNGPFLEAGLNAGWLWSGDDPVKHTPDDTFDHVQPESVERAGRLALAAVRSYP